jgi:hypothetical protein
VRYLQAYLQQSAQYDPARFAGAAEAVLVYVADLEAHTPVYQPQAFRGFVHGLWAVGLIDLEVLDRVDQYQLEDPALNPRS